MPSAIDKAKATYDAIAEKCSANPANKDDMADKAKAFNELRNLQREASRAGDDMTPSKRALQQEYVNRFADEVRPRVAKRVYGK